MPFEYVKAAPKSDETTSRGSFEYQDEDAPDFGEITKPEAEPILGREGSLEKKVPLLNSVMSAGRVAQREEAAVAEPLLAMLSRLEKASDDTPDQTPLLQSMIEASGRGARGEPYTLDGSGFRPAELGDVVRKGFDILDERGAHVPDAVREPLAAGGGLLASMGLPSSVLGGVVAKELSKGAQGVKRLAGTRDFLNIFRELRETKGMAPRAVADVMERGSGVKGDVALYAFEHPEILTKQNSAPERAQSIAGDVAKKVLDLTEKNPDAFGVNEKVPGEIAQNMIDNFDTLIGDAGKSLSKLKKAYGKDGNRVAVGEIEAGINKLLREKNYVDKKGKLLSAHEENPTALYLTELRDNLRKFGDKKFGLLNLNDLEGFKEIVRRKAYDRGTVDAGGLRRPDPELDRLGRQIYSRITDAIRAKYPENLVEAYGRYSDLADARARMSRKFGSPERLSTFLRNLDRKNPENMKEFAELVSNVPDGDKYLQDITKFLDGKANSLEGVFPWLNGRSKAKIASEVEKLMKKDYFSTDFGVDEKVALEKLGKALGVNLTKDYLDHYVAREFSKKSNMLRSLTATLIGGATGFAASGGAAAPGALLGYLMTDPKAQGKIIETYGKIKSSPATRTILNAAEKARPAAFRRGTVFLSQFNDDDEGRN